MKPDNLLRFLIFLVTPLIFISGAFATIVVRMSVPQMAERAQLLVEGTVTETKCRWDESHRYIITEAQVEISRTLKGKAGVQTITVRTLGGEVDGVGLYVSGAPRFVNGEETLLFLERHPVKDWRVVGLNQGKFTLITEKNSGRKMAVPSANGKVIPLETLESQLLYRNGDAR